MGDIHAKTDLLRGWSAVEIGKVGGGSGGASTRRNRRRSHCRASAVSEVDEEFGGGRVERLEVFWKGWKSWKCFLCMV